MTVLPVPVAETSRFLVMPALARQLNLLEQPLLERLWPDLDRTQDDSPWLTRNAVTVTPFFS